MKKYSLLKNHFLENYKIYTICFIIFIVGIMIGVLLVNNMTQSKKENIQTNFTDIITSLKDSNSEISTNLVLKKSLTKNTIIVLIIWIVGLNFLGKYFLSTILLVLGINFGYLVSCILASLEFKQAILFITSTLLLQNLIFLPSIFFLITRGIIDCNYHKIYNNRNHRSIKFTFTCLIFLLLLVNSSFVETYVATGFLKSIVKYL